MMDRIFNLFGYEKRVTDYDPRFAPDSWNRAHVPTAWASPAAVQSSSAVAHRAIGLKSTLMGSTPLKVFERLEDGTRKRDTSSALARVLARPNDDMTMFELIELVCRSLDLAGNFFARSVRTADGELAALHPITSGTVQIERVPSSGRLRYRVTDGNGKASVLLDHEVLHVKNHSADGIYGESPFTTARGALQLGLNLAEAASTIAASGMRISGVISHPGRLEGGAKKRIRDDFIEKGAGPKNAGSVLVFEEGMKLIPNQFSPADAELLASRKVSAEDTALIFGVPPAALGLQSTVSYGSAAQAALDLVTSTLNPLAARIEAAFDRALVTPGSGLFCEFDLSGLLRADPDARWRSYQIARNVGALSPNDIRKFENLPPVEGGDVYALTPPKSGSQI